MTTGNEDDPLAKVLPGWRLDNREVAWLWLIIESKARGMLEECQLNSGVMREQIARRLGSNQKLLAGLKRERDTDLLPDDAFSWIETSGRQPTWLLAQIRQRTGLSTRSAVLRTLSARDQAIALFDFWDTDFHRKKTTLDRLQKRWVEHVKTDRIFQWFRGKDETAKCALAWSWLEKNELMLTRRSAPFAKLDELLEFFDLSRASDGEKELYVEKIKRRWSTQKTRESATHKKQYNFVFTNDVNAVLDKLAEEHQLSRTKVLEKLLLNEIQHGLYLSSQ